MAAERLTNCELLRLITLSFDIDGVVANTAPLAVSWFNSLYDQTKKVEDLVEFDIMSEWVKLVSGREDYVKGAMEIWNDEGVLFNSTPVPGAIEVLWHLGRKGIKPFFITSRPVSTKDVTLRWFRKWLPWVAESQILMRDGTESGSKFKARMVKERGVGIHFEDAPKQATEIARSTNATVILVNQPWNLGWDLGQLNGNVIVRPSQEYSLCNITCSYYAMLGAIKNK